MAYDRTPGFVSEHTAYDETTVVVERERLIEGARHLRDTEGFNFGTMGLPAGPAGKGNVLCWAGFGINADSTR